MSNSTVRKRLHISGLTPAITIKDINARLQGFGSVLALDGFGALDALDQPRKFAYATLEATESNLARCVNVLSGTTWKGAKLRIGEAKPDYAQRLEGERKRAAEEAEERPLKRRRLPRGVQGVYSQDMAPVDVQTVDKHPGWHKTTLSHLIRPMKMRPVHPLPPPTVGTNKGSVPKDKKPRKSLSKRPDAPTRARIRTIDPRLYGSVHLRENMLDAVVVDTRTTKKPEPLPPSPSPSSSDDEDAPPAPPPARVFSPPPKLQSSVQPATPSVEPDLAEEKRRDLGLLMTIFGDDASDWGGKESVDSDLDALVADVKDNEPDSDSEEDSTEEDPESKQPEAVPVTVQDKNPKGKSLKDMFKPHEEEAGFSLLSGLDNIDIDPSFDLDFTAPAPVAAAAPFSAQLDSTPIRPFNAASLTLNSALPLFFPQPDNPRAKDLFSIARAEGWEFGRSGDADAIRQRWDAAKLTLTREWKKRSREAVKARKRRYGAAAEEEG